MNKLILHPTSTSQWHALVTEASKQCNAKLSEEIESYLVFLLMRFINAPSMLHKIMAIELLSSLHQPANERQQMLQAVGDSCLLFSGLFPGCARRRRVRVSYYIRLGQTAYSTLSTQSEQGRPSLFITLCDQFVQLMDTLQSMRELNNTQQSLDLLQAEEIWHDVKSNHALKTLQKFTSAPLIFNTNLISELKH